MISATFSGLRNPKTSPDSRELRMATPLTGNLMEGEENTYYKRVWRRGDSLRINTYHLPWRSRKGSLCLNGKELALVTLVLAGGYGPMRKGCNGPEV